MGGWVVGGGGGRVAFHCFSVFPKGQGSFPEAFPYTYPVPPPFFRYVATDYASELLVRMVNLAI